MPRIACILNPKARDGISSKSWPEFETALTAAGFEIDIHETQRVGHAMELHCMANPLCFVYVYFKTCSGQCCFKFGPAFR